MASDSLLNWRQYGVVTSNYWAFTLSDGALRMLIVLHFHQLGYTPLAIASLFLFYELFGIVTNIAGGWLAARVGLNKTMHLGVGLQILALSMLLVEQHSLSMMYVMAAQAISGIAKDLNKMSAKSSIKLLLPANAQGILYRWVAVLTGSKNALKGLGFFVGAILLAQWGFRGAIAVLASGLLAMLLLSLALLEKDLGKTRYKIKFTRLFAKSEAINYLSAARFFLFGARDLWFVVALPVYMQAVLHWSHAQIGTFMALWVISYGLVQAAAPAISPMGPAITNSLRWLKGLLALVPVITVFALWSNVDPTSVVVVGLFAFGAIFALTSAIHSYLIVAYAGADQVSLDVGFYYMCNAGGRLMGTILSGWVYQYHGLAGCLLIASLFILASAVLSWRLPNVSLH